MPLLPILINAPVARGAPAVRLAGRIARALAIVVLVGASSIAILVAIFGRGDRR